MALITITPVHVEVAGTTPLTGRARFAGRNAS